MLRACVVTSWPVVEGSIVTTELSAINRQPWGSLPTCQSALSLSRDVGRLSQIGRCGGGILEIVAAWITGCPSPSLFSRRTRPPRGPIAAAPGQAGRGHHVDRHELRVGNAAGDHETIQPEPPRTSPPATSHWPMTVTKRPARIRPVRFGGLRQSSTVVSAERSHRRRRAGQQACQCGRAPRPWPAPDRGSLERRCKRRLTPSVENCRGSMARPATTGANRAAVSNHRSPRCRRVGVVVAGPRRR